MKNIILKSLCLFDFLILPFVFFSSLPLKLYRRIGSSRLKVCTKLLKYIGVFPIRDHYYEPLFRDSLLTKNSSDIRHLPGLDLLIEDQLELLKKFNYKEE